jgi:pyruvate/2-oxoglutarate dehydrogenase complex dihydrolipoamide dehydrogenase (E3) component
MEADGAVLVRGPGGCGSAIRSAQLGARVAGIESDPEFGGTCLRVGCIPTKASVQTVFALKEVEETRWSVDGDRTVIRLAGELGHHLGTLTADEVQ